MYVAWFDAIVYANWLSERLGREKVYPLENIPHDPNKLDNDTLINWTDVPNWEANGFRLPTEAEWEYAARGGIYQDTFHYAGSSYIDIVAWYSSNSAEYHPTQRTNQVRTKKSNSLGLYDMSGNAYEWCWDWYGNYLPLGKVNHPKGPKNGDYRVLRGGSWYFITNYCHVLDRNYSINLPDNWSNRYGFRLSQGF